MAKQGMKRPERMHTHSRNKETPVPEIQGKAKHGKEHAKPIITGTYPPNQKVFHTTPFESRKNGEKSVSDEYSAIDNDFKG